MVIYIKWLFSILLKVFGCEWVQVTVAIPIFEIVAINSHLFIVPVETSIENCGAADVNDG